MELVGVSKSFIELLGEHRRDFAFECAKPV